MSTNKRRITSSSKQTQIQFRQTKAYQDQQVLRDEFAKKVETQNSNFNLQSGAKDSSTPYRSVNRVNSLLKTSPFLAQHGHAKLVESPGKFYLQMSSFDSTCKPSSATTVCTNAPNDFSTCKNDLSQNCKESRHQRSDKKNLSQKRLVGQKRQAQIKIDQMEYFTKLQSSVAKFVAKNLRLRDKKTGQVMEFSLLLENQIEYFKNSTIVTDFDMSKLEVEYDYDTEGEQITYSRDMLQRELFQAIEFFIKEDPLKLVENIYL